MIDCSFIAVADGYTAKNDSGAFVSVENVLTDSFFVPENIDNQEFKTISCEKESAEYVVVNTSDVKSESTVFSICSNPQKEKSISVRCCQSLFYTICNQISELLSLTVDNMKSFIVSVKRNIKRTANNLKGKHYKRRVYTLCLLRL